MTFEHRLDRDEEAGLRNFPGREILSWECAGHVRETAWK